MEVTFSQLALTGASPFSFQYAENGAFDWPFCREVTFLRRQPAFIAEMPK